MIVLCRIMSHLPWTTMVSKTPQIRLPTTTAVAFQTTPCGTKYSQKSGLVTTFSKQGTWTLVEKSPPLLLCILGDLKWIRATYSEHPVLRRSTDVAILIHNFRAITQKGCEKFALRWYSDATQSMSRSGQIRTDLWRDRRRHGKARETLLDRGWMDPRISAASTTLFDFLCWRLLIYADLTTTIHLVWRRLPKSTILKRQQESLYVLPLAELISSLHFSEKGFTEHGAAWSIFQRLFSLCKKPLVACFEDLIQLELYVPPSLHWANLNHVLVGQ